MYDPRRSHRDIPKEKERGKNGERYQIKQTRQGKAKDKNKTAQTRQCVSVGEEFRSLSGLMLHLHLDPPLDSAGGIRLVINSGKKGDKRGNRPT